MVSRDGIHVDEKSLMTRFILFGWLLVRMVAGCEIDCKPESVKHAIKREDIVFRGTITQITGSQVIFSVVRVWKGSVPAVLEMPKIFSAGPCTPGFNEAQIKVGSDLVVYAHWVPALPKLPGFIPPELLPGYVVGVCTKTAMAHDALTDLSKLGRGDQPRP
jgi:hypothetical protein